MKRNNGIVPVLVLLYVCGAGVAGWAGLKIFSPATHKKEIVTADTQAQQIAKDAAEQQTKLLADIQANREAIAAAQAELAAQKLVEQDAAGFVAGASMALAGEESPSVGVKIASTLIEDTGHTLSAPTTSQVIAFRAIVAQMRADNARISSALVQKEREAADAKTEAAKSGVAAKEAVALAASSDAKAQSAGELLTREAAAHASTLKALDEKVSEGVSFLGRLKFFGLSGGLLAFVLLPLTALAFPEAAPIVRAISAPFLKLWHMIHEREKAIMSELHGKVIADLHHVETALAAETASHVETKSMLVKVATAQATDKT